jgi:hypothetical protein
MLELRCYGWDSQPVSPTWFQQGSHSPFVGWSRSGSHVGSRCTNTASSGFSCPCAVWHHCMTCKCCCMLHIRIVGASGRTRPYALLPTLRSKSTGRMSRMPNDRLRSYAGSQRGDLRKFGRTLRTRPCWDALGWKV